MTRKVSIILGSLLGLFILFAVTVVVLFSIVKNDPIDKIAMTYIWNTREISNQVGDIRHVGRNVIEKSTKSDSIIIRPYSVETQGDSYLIFITLNKDGDKWVVSDYNIQNGDE